MWEFLTQLNRAGTTIILTTHYLEEAEQLCRNIAIIDGGLIVENSSMRELLATLNTETFVLDSAVALPPVPLIGSFVNKRVNDHCLEVVVDRGRNLNEVFAQLSGQGIDISSMRNKSNRLEELFLRLVQENSGHD